MSIFGNAKKAELKKEALDTKNWISDKELEAIFFEDLKCQIKLERN
ncbi:hypothetical protein [Limosilactobacillus vaginalis]|nr:hypothetical protein [Limosilactobacillus vaginalis]